MISVELVWQFILAQMLGFIILLFILDTLLYKPVLSTIRKRQDFVSNLLEEAQKLKEEAKSKLEQYKQAIQNAEEEGKKIYTTMLFQAKKVKEEKLVQLNELFKREQSEFSSQVEQDIQKEALNIEMITNQISNILLNNIVKGKG